MSDLFKKRNDGPTEPLVPEVITPPAIPPFRTWVVVTSEIADVQEDGADVYYLRTIGNCHDLEVSPDGLAVFSTIFFHHATNQVRIAVRYALAPGTWREIEEVNAEFNELVSN